jgi:hypothetical protein
VGVSVTSGIQLWIAFFLFLLFGLEDLEGTSDGKAFRFRLMPSGGQLSGVGTGNLSEETSLILCVDEKLPAWVGRVVPRASHGQFYLRMHPLPRNYYQENRWRRSPFGDRMEAVAMLPPVFL